MRATDILADPLVELTARLLTGPTRELYAVLWRVGVLQLEYTAPTGSDSETRRLQRAG